MEEQSKGTLEVKKRRKWIFPVILIAICGFLYFILFWYFLWPIIANALRHHFFDNQEEWAWYWALIWLVALIVWSIPLCILVCIWASRYKVTVKKRERNVSNNVDVPAPPYPTEMCLIQPVDKQEKQASHPVPSSFPAITIKNGQSPYRISEENENKSSSSSASSLVSKLQNKEDVSTRALYGGSRDQVTEDARSKFLAMDIIPGKRASDIGYVTAKPITTEKKKSSSSDQISSLDKFSQELIESRVSSSSSSSSSEKVDKKSDSMQFTLDVTDRKSESIEVTPESPGQTPASVEIVKEVITMTPAPVEIANDAKATKSTSSDIGIVQDEANADTEPQEQTGSDALSDETEEFWNIGAQTETPQKEETAVKSQDEQGVEEDDDVFLADQSSRNSNISEFNQYLHLVPISSCEAEPSRESVAGGKRPPLRRDSSEFFIASAYQKPSVTSEVFLTIAGDDSIKPTISQSPPPQTVEFVGSIDSTFHQVQ